MTTRSSPSEISTRAAKFELLVRPAYADLISVNSFDPASWREAVEPVTAGGRGSAWFVGSEGESWVLRHYCRGGYVARLSRRSYIFLGAGRVRSFAEFRLLNHLYEQGLPVPQPVAACYERVNGLFYRAAIIVQRIRGAVPLADFLVPDDPELWMSAGQLIRRFHEAGVYHADLNCHNILVAGEALYLIDFDKGRSFGSGALPGRLRERNLLRLKRSLEKQAGRIGIAAGVEGKWSALLSGYESPGPGGG